MKRIKTSLLYGHQAFDLECVADLLLTGDRSTYAPPDPINLALANPIGCHPLREHDFSGKSVAIITSDVTRPCITDRLLPPLMIELERSGVKDRDVMVVFGLGIHRSHSPMERSSILGEDMYSRLTCVDSDPTQVTEVGLTSRGTPVEVFEPVAKADIRIALGSVVMHYFAGYSGGYKALVPGVCSARTVRHNHAMMVKPQARASILEGNPVREDIEEAASIIGLDFIINVVLDHKHDLMAAFAGHPLHAHRKACQMVSQISQVPFRSPADIVIVGSGGYPKDINLYQAHKALDNAAKAAKKGGLIIWIAECPEGFGNLTFEEWLVGLTMQQILDLIQKDFVLGGHKAAAIVKVLRQASVWLVSSLPPAKVHACGLTPYNDLNRAIEDAIKLRGPKARIIVIPDGSSVLPIWTQ
jgi:nickel-dependent lactate racemase